MINQQIRTGYRQPFTRNRFQRNTDNIANVNEVLNLEDLNLTRSVPGWTMYLSSTKYNSDGMENKLLKHFKLFLTESDFNSQISKIITNREVKIDLKNIFNNNNRDVINFIEEEPLKAKDILGLACHQLLYEHEMKRVNNASLLTNNNYTAKVPSYINAVLCNWPDNLKTTIRNLKANCIGRVVIIRGIVSCVSNVQPVCTQLAYTCSKCSYPTVILQAEHLRQFKVPSRCPKCNGRAFGAKYDSNLTLFKDVQTIKVQSDQIDDNDDEEDRIPRSIEVKLSRSLVDKCAPGDHVTISGVVEINSNRTEKQSSFNIWLNAFSLETENSVPNGLNDEFSIEDLQIIQQLHSQGPDLINILVNSLCPSIYGHEMLKAGMIYSIVSGCFNNEFSRSNIHCLLVGDPGTGKSQLLKACASVAPRSVYICGNTSSTAGLTVSIGKSSGSNYSVESGALVMSDGGICCIDELDKIIHSPLLEAMEQQRVSVAKAGIVCSLPTRCSVLAAANPTCGHYDRSRSVLENVKIKLPLLSRFDLIFLMVDQTSYENDEEISRFISDGYKTSSQNHIAQDIMKKYLTYAIRYVKPSLTSEASNILKEYYLKVRKESNDIPVTLRFLESLIRVCKARSRLLLRSCCVAEDAEEAVSLMQFCIDKVKEQINPFVTSNKRSKNSKTQARKKFIENVRNYCECTQQNRIDTRELKKISSDCGMDIDEFNTLFTGLNECGVLIKKDRNLYEFMQ